MTITTSNPFSHSQTHDALDKVAAPHSVSLDGSQMMLDPKSADIYSEMQGTDSSGLHMVTIEESSGASGARANEPRDIYTKVDGRPPKTDGDKPATSEPPEKRKEGTSEDVQKTLDEMNLDPKVEEIAEKLREAYFSGDLKSLVEGFAEIVKDNSDDPKALKEAVDALVKALGKNGYSETMTVKEDGTLVLGPNIVVISPDGTYKVNPMESKR